MPSGLAELQAPNRPIYQIRATALAIPAHYHI